MSLQGKSAVIVGATGQVGRHVLQNLLASSEFTRVGEYGRRVTPADQITTGKDKLEQKVIDFEKIEESGLKDGKWDVVYITLGTTRAAVKSDEEFEKIDRVYVARAAKEARNPELPFQRIVYCSSGGADSSSRFLYTRCKGLVEEDLSSLGYADTIIFRPGVLSGTQRHNATTLETLAVKITGFTSRFTDKFGIDAGTLGKSFYLAGVLGSQSLQVPSSKGGKADNQFTLIQNSAAIKLAEKKK